MDSPENTRLVPPTTVLKEKVERGRTEDFRHGPENLPVSIGNPHGRFLAAMAFGIKLNEKALYAEYDANISIQISGAEMNHPVGRYEEQVYAGVLGKIIGVYMGRPFEGWPKARIVERWGNVDRYVHADLDKPLVVADDDISGTFTFVRAIEDSGQYAETTGEDFGNAWLNYLLEGKTILWWGGMGHSTEHTAYLRLKHGYPVPLSGSIALNGRTVAEQIGAQIFIDAIGLVTPGAPELAAKLARNAAQVSHDGEAVHAAVVVAAMVSAAFVIKDMSSLLDRAISLIPPDSLIARVHRDVRNWCAADGDWQRTYDRIDEVYGYHRYGGNCHVIPNHAVMVMAWCYGGNSFRRAQAIINTAGWDTDCNAANVGSVMGVLLGLDGINAEYDFRGPVADRMIVPTADGTSSVTDAMTQAVDLARVGRRVMGWPVLPPEPIGLWHNFALPGAVQGYSAEAGAGITVGHGEPGPGRPHCLSMELSLTTAQSGRVWVPVLPEVDRNGGYGVVATPRLYPGMTVTATCLTGPISGTGSVRLIACSSREEGETVCTGEAVALASVQDFTLSLAIPDLAGHPVCRLGLEFCSGETELAGMCYCSQVCVTGRAGLVLPRGPVPVGRTFSGWIFHGDVVRGAFSDEKETVLHVGKNEGRGILVTGNRHWSDYVFSARVSIHVAAAGGILVHYQGMERYIALVKTPTHLVLLKRCYRNEILREVPAVWDVDELHELRIECTAGLLRAFCDGALLVETEEHDFSGGGAGFLFEDGLIGLRDVKLA